MATLRFAQVFVRGVPTDRIESALAGVMARDGYLPFDEARIPPAYPAEAGEFDRWLIAGPDPAGTITLLSQSVRRAFGRAGDLAAALPGAILVALVRPPADPLRVKTYRNGTLELKIGEDPDDELFYTPLVAEAPAIQAFLQAWGAAPGADVIDPESMALALGVVRSDRTFEEARAGGWPVPVTLRTFASSRSRLYRES